jgi:hypothetical protein
VDGIGARWVEEQAAGWMRTREGSMMFVREAFKKF